MTQCLLRVVRQKYASVKLLSTIFICSSVYGNNFFSTNKNMASYDYEQRLKDLSKLLPPQLSEGKHKGQAGRIGVIGGSAEYTGAPYFSGITSLKTGGDLIYIFCMKAAAIPIKSYSPELIVFPYLDDENGQSLMIPRLHNLHSLVIGPGLGEDPKVHSLILSILQHVKQNLSKISLVFDADAIGLLANNKDILKEYAGTVYVTPNVNEIKKLSSAYLGQKDINIEDHSALKSLVSNIGSNVTLILKGRNDQIVTQNTVFQCSTPGSLRRCGGQGDLLSGALALFGYWATLYKLEEQSDNLSVPSEVLASYAASSLVRTCSRIAYEKKGRSMTTSNMIESIGEAYNTIF